MAIPTSLNHHYVLLDLPHLLLGDDNDVALETVDDNDVALETLNTSRRSLTGRCSLSRVTKRARKAASSFL